MKFGSAVHLTYNALIPNLINGNGTDVVFTSILDDTRKGDSNGDEAATPPAANDWEGIWNRSGWVNIWDEFFDSH